MLDRRTVRTAVIFIVLLDAAVVEIAYLLWRLINA